MHQHVDVGTDVVAGELGYDPIFRQCLLEVAKPSVRQRFAMPSDGRVGQRGRIEAFGEVEIDVPFPIRIGIDDHGVEPPEQLAFGKDWPSRMNGPFLIDPSAPGLKIRIPVSEEPP